MDVSKATECYKRILSYLLEKESFGEFLFDGWRGQDELYVWNRDHPDAIKTLRKNGVEIETGMTKMVLIYAPCGWVCKIPFTSKKKPDYCKIEVENYERAKEAGVEQYFAPVQIMDVYISPDGLVQAPVYLMEYAEVDEEKLGKTYSEITGAQDSENYDFDEELVLDFFEQVYGYECYCELTEFLDDNGINDVHGGNIGLAKDGYWVIIDYSGF